MSSSRMKQCLGAVALGLAALAAAPAWAQAIGAPSGLPAAGPDGVIKVRSAYSSVVQSITSTLQPNP